MTIDIFLLPHPLEFGSAFIPLTRITKKGSRPDSTLLQEKAEKLNLAKMIKGCFHRKMGVTIKYDL